jgi:hypothetical protein
MSMTICAYHLGEAATALAEAGRLLAVARQHIADAEPHDVDPKVAGAVYGPLKRNLPIMTADALLAGELCEGLVTSRRPDLDRERAAIDAEREGYRA